MLPRESRLLELALSVQSPRGTSLTTSRIVRHLLVFAPNLVVTSLLREVAGIGVSTRSGGGCSRGDGPGRAGAKDLHQLGGGKRFEVCPVGQHRDGAGR